MYSLHGNIELKRGLHKGFPALTYGTFNNLITEFYEDTYKSITKNRTSNKM
jgi:hypothetical protein